MTPARYASVLFDFTLSGMMSALGSALPQRGRWG